MKNTNIGGTKRELIKMIEAKFRNIQATLSDLRLSDVSIMLNEATQLENTVRDLLSNYKRDKVENKLISSFKLLPTGDYVLNVSIPKFEIDTNVDIKVDGTITNEKLEEIKSYIDAINSTFDGADYRLQDEFGWTIIQLKSDSKD